MPSLNTAWRQLSARASSSLTWQPHVSIGLHTVHDCLAAACLKSLTSRSTASLPSSLTANVSAATLPSGLPSAGARPRRYQVTHSHEHGPAAIVSTIRMITAPLPSSLQSISGRPGQVGAGRGWHSPHWDGRHSESQSPRPRVKGQARFRVTHEQSRRGHSTSRDAPPLG